MPDNKEDRSLTLLYQRHRNELLAFLTRRVRCRETARDLLQDAFVRLAATMLLSMKGSVCLYQGEELGLTEAELAFEDLVDPYGIEFWPQFKGRDGCRTPMVWQSAVHLGGFSTAPKPWLPVPFDHLSRAADLQLRRPVSAGALGERSALETPYSSRVVTAETIEQTAPNKLGDLFFTDASVSDNSASVGAWARPVVPARSRSSSIAG